MGFLIFACRKLSLKSKITDLQYRQMVLQNQKSTIEDQISQRQQCYSNAKDGREMYLSQAMMQMRQSIFQQAGYNPNNQNLTPDYNQRMMQAQMQASMDPRITGMMQQNQIQSMFEDERNNMDLQSLARKDKQIEREMATLESQLKLATNELESVEKAEDNAAKQDTPKFGLS